MPILCMFPQVLIIKCNNADIVYLKSMLVRFRYMAISDDRQRIMPSTRDRTKGKKLAYPEAVLLTNPSNPELKGEVSSFVFFVL